MKKLLIYALFFVAFAVKAQEGYFSAYQVVVEPQEVEMIYKLTNDYFTANKPTGVTVSLWENHFNDPTNNFTHSIVFTGSLEDLGNMYARDGGDSWTLFLTRLNQHIKDGFSAFAGTSIAHWGDLMQDYPVQTYYLLDVEDSEKFIPAMTKYNNAHNPAGSLLMVGNITTGRSSDGGSHWIIRGYKDFKGALGGVRAMRTEAQQAASDKAWKEQAATNGGVNLVRSGTRVRLGQW